MPRDYTLSHWYTHIILHTPQNETWKYVVHKVLETRII